MLKTRRHHSASTFTSPSASSSPVFLAPKHPSPSSSAYLSSAAYLLFISSPNSSQSPPSISSTFRLSYSSPNSPPIFTIHLPTSTSTPLSTTASSISPFLPSTHPSLPHLPCLHLHPQPTASPLFSLQLFHLYLIYLVSIFTPSLQHLSPFPLLLPLSSFSSCFASLPLHYIRVIVALNTRSICFFA